MAHAHEDQWEDVLRLAVGHARRRERADLLTGVLDRADQEPSHAHRLRLLAAICLEFAVELDPSIRQRVESALAEVVPPRSAEDAKALAAAGPIVLELLPGPEGLDPVTAHHVVVCATTVGTERAIPLLRRFADHPSQEVRAQLAWAWDRFDRAEYGAQVVARLSHDDGLRFVVRGREDAAFLASLGGRSCVQYQATTGLPGIELLPPDTLNELRLHETVLDEADLALLDRFPQLRRLQLTRCHCPSLAALAATAVRRLLVRESTLRGLEALTGLTALDLWDCAAQPVPGLPRLATLTLDPADRFEPAQLTALTEMADLRLVHLYRGTFPDLGGLVLPQVGELYLTAVTLTPERVAQIPRVFPGLRAVTAWATERLDLLPAQYPVVRP
ncbi:hypothetical protein ACFQZC_21420 [Streptacidiphilus monticola]